MTHPLNNFLFGCPSLVAFLGQPTSCSRGPRNSSVRSSSRTGHQGEPRGAFPPAIPHLGVFNLDCITIPHSVYFLDSPRFGSGTRFTVACVFKPDSWTPISADLAPADLTCRGYWSPSSKGIKVTKPGILSLCSKTEPFPNTRSYF